MNKTKNQLATVAFLLAALVAAPSTANSADPECYVFYDAGSTATRLHIYFHKNGKWEERTYTEELPPLALPSTRKIDHNAVREAVEALKEFEAEYDWKKDCNKIASIQILGTGGMRLAERRNAVASASMWQTMHESLYAMYNGHVDWSKITAKTMTGFEEALYAWLAVREEKAIKDNNFGVAEMGGASAQLAFTCKGNCPGGRKVALDPDGTDKTDFFGYSFLGYGTKEAPKHLGFNTLPRDCAWGRLLVDAFWVKKDCLNTFESNLVNVSKKIIDPISGEPVTFPNYGHLADWYLTGNGLFYMKTGGSVDDCCKKRTEGRKCFDRESSCFLDVYRPRYLEALGIKYTGVDQAKKAESAWTLGAAICASSGCLKHLNKPLVCRWLSPLPCLPPTIKP